MKLSNEHLQNVLDQLYKAYPKSFETKELSLLITGEEKDGRILGCLAWKKTLIYPHTGTFVGKYDLYGLGKIRIPVSREFNQSSCGIERLWCERSRDEK